MPHIVDINCPNCNEPAVFEFAEVVKIKLKKDVPFFKQNNLFEYHLFQNYSGHNWHGAIYYANLHGGSVAAIGELPEGYEPKDWKHSRYLMRNHGSNLGAFICNHCQSRKIHILNWPDDSYYSISIKNEVLWAFNRESALDLRDYIESNERKIDNFKWSSFLLHIPTIFKKQNNRSNVIKQLNKLLA